MEPSGLKRNNLELQPVKAGIFTVQNAYQGEYLFFGSIQKSSHSSKAAKENRPSQGSSALGGWRPTRDEMPDHFPGPGAGRTAGHRHRARPPGDHRAE